MREMDPKTMAEVKDAAFLKRVISETQVAKRKCDFFAGLATDPKIQKIFQSEYKNLENFENIAEEYYRHFIQE
ncbi:hypothetical protein [Desulfotruncus alcoholivorax]|uniref:hypothetical protein n=1 Tax=Desulfotruncus alcoholivorax TaxID=265477 RepID=UPI00040DA87C|nr:hypothetical protein [Desulfotruncus alcoholivorax]